MKQPTNREYLDRAIASIRILKQSNSPLTEQERGILLAFPGGGILKECGVFTDDDKPRWLVEGREELRSLLTTEEWEGVQNSGMQNSHYTLPEIRKAMWEAIMPLLPHDDHIQVLDPGCGTAGFLWSMPNDVRLEYHGVDKDILPVAIAQKAIGRSKHRVMKRDFLEYDPNPLYKYGVTIGNVPFVNGINSIKVDGKKLGIAIHAQFFIKSVQCLAPGGVLCFLTSTSTLDSKGEDYVWFRKWLHRKCEFIGALRLPADAVHYGGTQVTTDLVILRKRYLRSAQLSQDSSEPDPNWVHVGESDLINEHYNIPVLYNRWFIDHPEYLLGDRTVSKVRGKNGNPTNCLALQSRPNFLKELREALSNLTQGNVLNNREDYNIMATVTLIPADKFKTSSALSFILRENPKREGIEVHFPPDCNLKPLEEEIENQKQAKEKGDSIKISSSAVVLKRVKSMGFTVAKSNPSLFYIKPRTTEEYDRIIESMRETVKQCTEKGAYELDTNTPVEEIKSRRREVNKSKPVETATAIPIVDAIALRLQPLFDEVISKIQTPTVDPGKVQELESKVNDYLHRWQKDQETIKTLTSEVERLRVIAQDLHYLEEYKKANNELKAENDDLRSQINTFLSRNQELIAENHALANSLKDSVEECRNLENSLQEAIYENENLKTQLAEFGVNPTSEPEDDNTVDLSDDDDIDLDDVDLTDDDELPVAFQTVSSSDDSFDTSAIGGDDDDDFDTSLLMGE